MEIYTLIHYALLRSQYKFTSQSNNGMIFPEQKGESINL